MICPGCSTHNQDDFKFCRECGRRLAPPSAGGEPTVASAAPPPGDGAAPAPAARLDEAAQAGRLLDQAFDLYDEGRYAEALGACQASLALDPSGSTAHSLLGMIYERMGKTAEAVQQYQIVLKMNPDSIADATRLDSLLGRRDTARGPASMVAFFQRRRLPAAAGAAAAGLALLAGLWVTARAMSPGANGGQGATPRDGRGPIPGASMPRPSAPTTSMPGAEEALAPPQRGAAPATSTIPGASLPPAAGRPSAAVPLPPPAGAWPGLRGAYPPATPAGRSTGTASSAVPGASLPPARHEGHRSSRPGASGYLAPAPIQGLERLNPNEASGPAPLPGASLPVYPGAASQSAFGNRGSRGPAPVLPLVTDDANRRSVAATPPPQTAAPTPPQPPPSASISIQPLDEQQPADSTRGARQSATPQPRAVTLGEALQHQQMAAYYRRQGDHQAAYDEYQYARDLFRSIQQRGGRDAAVAAQGAVAAQYGMSRLQAP